MEQRLKPIETGMRLREERALAEVVRLDSRRLVDGVEEGMGREEEEDVGEGAGG